MGVGGGPTLAADAAEWVSPRESRRRPARTPLNSDLRGLYLLYDFCHVSCWDAPFDLENVLLFDFAQPATFGNAWLGQRSSCDTRDVPGQCDFITLEWFGEDRSDSHAYHCIASSDFFRGGDNYEGADFRVAALWVADFRPNDASLEDPLGHEYRISE